MPKRIKMAQASLDNLRPGGLAHKLTDEDRAKGKEVLRQRRSAQAAINRILDSKLTPKQIKQWVKEERLQFADDSPVVFQCETCGTSIKTGRYCDACKKNQGNIFAKAAARPEIPKPEPKKHESKENKMRHFS